MNLLIARKLLAVTPKPHEAPVILDTYANTSSAGSMIAFHKHHDDLPVGSLGVLSSFGAGYSIGSVILRKRGPISPVWPGTDAELLARLLAGEQRAFRELVSTYQGAMRAMRLCHRRQSQCRRGGAGCLAGGGAQPGRLPAARQPEDLAADHYRQHRQEPSQAAAPRAAAR